MKITIFSEELRKCLNAAGLSDCGENDTWNYWYQRLMSAYNESVERQIMTEQAENAELLEQMERLVTLLRNDCDIDASWDGLRKFWSIGLTEDGCLMRDRACKAEADNAKLRELLADQLMQPRDYCQKYGIEYDSWDSANDHLDARMRELGVEVPDGD